MKGDENVQEEGLKAAYQGASRHSWTKEELDAYDYAAMREQDGRGRITFAFKQGKREVARKMKAEGVSLDEIVRWTGLERADVEGL